MKCNLCPRACMADRSLGETGYCKMTEEAMVARVAPHYWEEPCISGETGSGTVFFSGCNLRCVYCQNAKIAAGGLGKKYSDEELCEAFLSLQEKGCANINLVTPSHYAVPIIRALKLAKQRGLNVPVVYNTSSYERVETLRMWDGLVDIYLADLKYLTPELAGKYSHAADYPQTATDAIAEMVRQTGGAVYELKEAAKTTISGATEYPDGAMMKRGVIVRHLLLPGYVDEAKKVVSYLVKTYRNTVAVSIMNQYTPLPHVKAYPELCRKVTEEEYDEVVDYAISIGLEHGFLQEGEAASESFIPEFFGED